MYKYVVAYSGGCDSTLALYDTAREYGTPKTPVFAVTIDHYQVPPSQRERERIKRNAFLKWAEKEGLHIRHGTITISGEGGVSYRKKSGDGGNPQAYFWAIQAVQVVADDGWLGYGYVRSDDIWHKRVDIETAITSYAKILERKINVWYPLEWMRKSDVIARLDKIGILDYTWYCESPKGTKPCGDCESCRTHIIGLEYLKRWGDADTEPNS